MSIFFNKLELILLIDVSDENIFCFKNLFSSQALYGDFNLAAAVDIQQTTDTRKPEWKSITYLMM